MFSLKRSNPLTSLPHYKTTWVTGCKYCMRCIPSPKKQTIHLMLSHVRHHISCETTPFSILYSRSKSTPDGKKSKTFYWQKRAQKRRRIHFQILFFFTSILFFSENLTGSVSKLICLCIKQILTIQQGGLNLKSFFPDKSYNLSKRFSFFGC